MHDYRPLTYQFNVIGSFHTPKESKEFDEEFLHEFIPCFELDLSPPAQASPTTHRDWRRRAIRQLYEEREITSVQCPLLLATVNECAHAMETTNSPPQPLLNAPTFH